MQLFSRLAEEVYTVGIVDTICNFYCDFVGDFYIVFSHGLQYVIVIFLFVIVIFL